MSQRWLDASLSKKGMAVVILPTLALLVSFVGFLSVALTSRSALNGVQSSLQARSSLQSILALTIDAETGVRGYIISDNSSYLTPYDAARHNLSKTYASLSKELSGDTKSLNMVSKLRLTDMADMALLTNLLTVSENGSSQSQVINLLAQEKHQTDQVRSLVSSLDLRIATLVSNKEANARDTENAGLWVALAALVLGLAGGAVSTQLFTTGIGSRIRLLQDGAENLAKGKPLGEFPAASDEVGKLGEALKEASRLLEAREAKLLEESAFLEHLVSASPVVKFQGNSALPGDGFVSSNLDRVFSLSATEVSLDGGVWLDAIDPSDRLRVIEESRRAIANQNTELVSSYRLRGNDGIQRWVYSTTTLSYGENEDLASALGVLLDVTEGKEAEEALHQREEMLRALFDASPDAILVVEQSGKIIMASKSTSVTTGVGLSSLEHSSLLNFLDPEQVPELMSFIGRSALSEGKSFIQRMKMLNIDDGWKIVEAHGVPMQFMGSGDAILMVLRDVSEQVELQEKLIAATNTADLANRAKSEFLSRMSHELRTPLNAVLGFAQILEMDELTDDQRESIAQIRRGGQHLLQLINEVLDISRIESGQLTISREQVGIAEIINEVCNLMRPMAEAREIVISVRTSGKDSAMVLADRQRLRQILLNLVSNAIKYNRLKGTVTVSYVYTGDLVTISVADTGPGIAPENIELAFAPFERLGAEATEVEGTGIGLTLSRRLAEVMGGALELESSPQGCVFSVLLPYGGTQAESQNGAPPRTGQTESDLPGTEIAILYVEDNPSNVRLIERALSRVSGIQLRTTSSGREAIELSQTMNPGLILLDVHLPDLGGEEVLRQLRLNTATAEIPVVVLSADATESQMRKLMDAGALEYLTKPIDIERLYQIIDLVRGQDLHRQRT